MKDDLKKRCLDRGSGKDRERWKAQIMRKTSDLREHGRKTRRERKISPITLIKLRNLETIHEKKEFKKTAFSNGPHLRSFCVLVLASSFAATELNTLLASLAKSRSRTSCGDTGTTAKASLSSLIAAQPT